MELTKAREIAFGSVIGLASLVYLLSNPIKDVKVVKPFENPSVSSEEMIRKVYEFKREYESSKKKASVITENGEDNWKKAGKSIDSLLAYTNGIMNRLKDVLDGNVKVNKNQYDKLLERAKAAYKLMLNIPLDASFKEHSNDNDFVNKIKEYELLLLSYRDHEPYVIPATLRALNKTSGNFEESHVKLYFYNGQNGIHNNITSMVLDSLYDFYKNKLTISGLIKDARKLKINKLE